MHVGTGLACLGGAILVVVKRAVRRAKFIDIGAAVPFVPTIAAFCPAIAPVVAYASVMTPALELMTFLLLSKVGSDAPIPEGYGMDGNRAFGVDDPRNLAVTIQTRGGDATHLRVELQAQKNTTQDQATHKDLRSLSKEVPAGAQGVPHFPVDHLQEL